MCAAGSTGLSIVAAPKAVLREGPRTSRHVPAQQLQLATLLKRPRNRQRARIQMPARLQWKNFRFLKAQHEKWLRSVSASSAAKSPAQHARAATVRAVRALL